MFTKVVAAVAALASTSVALAGDYRLVRPREVYVDLYEYDGPRHDPYLDPIDADLSHGGTFNVDMDIFKYRGYGLYWDNKLFFDQSRRTGKVVHGGWDYEVGLTAYVSKRGAAKVEFFRQHESRHIFEHTRDEHFPVYDRMGIRLRVYP